jgi:hypothetical protein
VQASIPCGHQKIGPWKHKRCGQMQRVEAGELEVHGERGAVLDQILIDLDNSERWPLFSDCFRSRLACGKGHSTSGLDEIDTTDEPGVGAIHRTSHEVAPRLSH